MARYIRGVAERLTAIGVTATPYLTQSNGGVIGLDAAARLPVRTVLSGPSTGVVGAQVTAQLAGAHDIITFDMDGTSTDVALMQGSEARLAREAVVHDYPIKAPMLDIHTVGAGGGSIVFIDTGGLLKVGPRSAGADPGPACYDRGNDERTVTDANVVLQTLNPTQLLGGRMRIRPDLARAAIDRIAARLGIDALAAAQGIIAVVTANMARAIRVISVQRGHDPRDYTLVAFGGAGPLHAARLAAELDIRRVLVPRNPGILCAMGLLLADLRADFAATRLMALSSPVTARSRRSLPACAGAAGCGSPMRAGKLQEDVKELILLNCQVPRERLSDLRAQMAANRLGVQRMQALCGKYGTETVLAVGDALQDYAERKMRAGIAALPDGTYRFADTYDNPELGRALPVSVEITIEGNEMRLHFDSPPQVRAGINMIYTALLSSVYYAVKAVVDPTILPNSGLARPITVTAPLGTVMNAAHPAAVNGRTSTCQRAADLVDRRTGAGRARAMHRRRQRLLCDGELCGHRPEGWAPLGLSRNYRWRLRRTRPKGWARRCPRPHDQHLEPAGRSARGRIPIDGPALRAGGRVRRCRPIARRYGATPGLPCRGGMPFAARRFALVHAALGARGWPPRRLRRLPPGQRSGGFRQRSR